MSSPVFTVEPDVAIQDAARLLLRHAITAVPVVTAEGELVGIVSEVDLLRGAVPADPVAHVIPPADAPAPPALVRDVMTTQVFGMTEDADISDVAEQLRMTGVKSMPILRGGHVMGVISRRDLLRIVARNDEDVRHDVVARLRACAGSGFSPRVAVDHGVVTIEVDRPSVDGIDERAARLLVQSVPGSIRVHLSASPALGRS